MQQRTKQKKYNGKIDSSKISFVLTRKNFKIQKQKWRYSKKVCAQSFGKCYQLYSKLIGELFQSHVGHNCLLVDIFLFFPIYMFFDQLNIFAQFWRELVINVFQFEGTKRRTIFCVHAFKHVESQNFIFHFANAPSPSKRVPTA